jgi:hypothetical protein
LQVDFWRARGRWKHALVDRRRAAGISNLPSRGWPLSVIINGRWRSRHGGEFHQRHRHRDFVAYLSSLCQSPLHTATQYALLTAFAAISQNLSFSRRGLCRAGHRLADVPVLSVLVAIPSLILLAWLQLAGDISKRSDGAKPRRNRLRRFLLRSLRHQRCNRPDGLSDYLCQPR